MKECYQKVVASECIEERTEEGAVDSNGREIGFEGAARQEMVLPGGTIDELPRHCHFAVPNLMRTRPGMPPLPNVVRAEFTIYK